MYMKSRTQVHTPLRVGRAGAGRVRYTAMAGTLALVLMMLAVPASAAAPGLVMNTGAEYQISRQCGLSAADASSSEDDDPTARGYSRDDQWGPAAGADPAPFYLVNDYGGQFVSAADASSSEDDDPTARGYSREEQWGPAAGADPAPFALVDDYGGQFVLGK